jgi:hypothetical protein
VRGRAIGSQHPSSGTDFVRATFSHQGRRKKYDERHHERENPPYPIGNAQGVS